MASPVLQAAAEAVEGVAAARSPAEVAAAAAVAAAKEVTLGGAEPEVEDRSAS